MPTIFSAARRRSARQRMRRLQAQPGAPRYVLDDMIEDTLDRLGFLRHRPARALVIGDWSGALARELRNAGCEVTAAAPEDGLDEEQPLAPGGFDLVASLGTLDTVNDLPGALTHLHRALAPSGLLIAQFPGAGSLPELRRIMLAADAERPAARLHPMIDVRAGAQLLQRAGFADPVADARTLAVRFASLDRLVADLRAQALSNALARPGPPLTRPALDRARAAASGPIEERFEILTLTGWFC